MKLDNKKFFVFGYFGYETNQLDGQTIKTRNVYKLLEEHAEKEKLAYADTQAIRKKPILLFSALWKIINSDYLFFIPARNSLKQIFPIVFALSKIFQFKIIYIAVGGWLDEFLSNYQILSKMLSQICILGCENKELVNSLQKKFNFKNVVLFPNFRFTNFQPDFLGSKSVFSIVFMARIMREKGIDIVFDVAKKIERKYPNVNNISITFYGPIIEKDKDYFYDNLKKYKTITYKGVLDPENIVRTLSKYDVMIFPTQYLTEGFPGTVLDAYLSGIPVIASNWMYANEFITDGGCGYICDSKDSDQFFSRIDMIYRDRNLLYKMKKAAFEEGKKYSPDVAWNVISCYLSDKK